MEVWYLNCCLKPDIESVKVLLDTNRESESLCRCKNCGQYWFHRFLETFMTDNQTTWYSRVEPEEAEIIIKSKDRPDLTFLLSRETFRHEDGKVKRVSGQPDKSCY